MVAYVTDLQSERTGGIARTIAFFDEGTFHASIHTVVGPDFWFGSCLAATMSLCPLIRWPEPRFQFPDCVNTVRFPVGGWRRSFATARALSGLIVWRNAT